MELRKVNKDIILLTFSSQKDMCDSLLRFQEHYESPKFRGKIFTIGQYRQYEVETKGIYEYSSSVHGMNFPDTTLQPFIEGLFDPLTEEESILVELLRHRKSMYYIVATYEGADESITSHEICHAMFYTNQAYRSDVEKCLSKYNLSSIYKWLKAQSYHKSTFLDEANAYICIDHEYLIRHGVKFDVKLPEKLTAIKMKHFKKLDY